MPPLSMLIKPASGSCNLRCKYCFYLDEVQNRTVSSYGRMSTGTLENIVKKAFDYADTSCTFGFQGGEPTLAGLSFYQELINLQRQYNRKNLLIQNTIQTNGTLLTEEWAKFFHDNHFLVGLSLDGPRKVHDQMRIDNEGNGTFGKILRAAHLLDKYHVEYNILCVVNHYVAQNVEAVYHFYKANGFRYIQPIACLEPLGEEPGLKPYSLTPEDYSFFLKTLFDLWYKDIMAKDIVVVRTFDNYLALILGYRPEMCSMQGHCMCQSVIEADGSIFPCDFYVLDKWKLGNINDINFETAINCETTKHFMSLSTRHDPECRKCKWQSLCHGGCRREREQADGNLGHNYLCPAYKEFFEYAYPRLKEISNVLASRGNKR